MDYWLWTLTAAIAMSVMVFVGNGVLDLLSVRTNDSDLREKYTESQGVVYLVGAGLISVLIAASIGLRLMFPPVLLVVEDGLPTE